MGCVGGRAHLVGCSDGYRVGPADGAAVGAAVAGAAAVGGADGVPAGTVGMNVGARDGAAVVGVSDDGVPAREGRRAAEGSGQRPHPPKWETDVSGSRRRWERAW